MIAGNLIVVLNANGTVDLIAKQGTTWSLEVALTDESQTPINLTQYSARGQIRSAFDATEVIESFTCTITVPATGGKVLVSLDALNTKDIVAYESHVDSSMLANIPSDAQGVYVYDVEIYTGTPEEVMRVIEGKLFVDPEVTK